MRARRGVLRRAARREQQDLLLPGARAADAQRLRARPRLLVARRPRPRGARRSAPHVLGRHDFTAFTPSETEHTLVSMRRGARAVARRRRRPRVLDRGGHVPAPHGSGCSSARCSTPARALRASSSSRSCCRAVRGRWRAARPPRTPCSGLGRVRVLVGAQSRPQASRGASRHHGALTWGPRRPLCWMRAHAERAPHQRRRDRSRGPAGAPPRPGRPRRAAPVRHRPGRKPLRDGALDNDAQAAVGHRVPVCGRVRRLRHRRHARGLCAAREPRDRARTSPPT